MTEGTAFVLNAHVRYGLVAVRALGRRGIDVAAGSSRRFSAGSMSRHVDRFVRYPAPESDPAGFLDALESELAANDYDLLLPINRPTVELVARNRSRLTAHANIPFLPYDRLAVGFDKERTIEAARRYDVPHPRTQLPAETDLATVGSTLGYPVVVKPVRGTGRVGVRTCDSRAGLERAYREVTDEFGPALVQEYVPHGGERGVYALYDRETTLTGVVVQRRLRSHPPEGGPSTFRETVEDEALVDVADRLLSSLGWFGVAMVEFRIDPRTGQPKLMEINPRLWGSLALSVFAGVDFPYMLYQLATGESPEPTLEYRTGVQARNLFTDAVQVAARSDTLRAVREYLTPPSKPCCYDIVSATDPLPTLGHALYGLECLFRRRFGGGATGGTLGEPRGRPGCEPATDEQASGPTARTHTGCIEEVH